MTQSLPDLEEQKQKQNSFVQECSDVERWVVEDVEREEEEEKCSDQPRPFCQDIQVVASAFYLFVSGGQG